MTRKICFAGFGQKEVEALQPSLAALGGAWDCVFSTDAAAALDVLAADPFDVVVVNLSPGGIHDAELLHQAAVRQPKTLRFVLGDVADRELIVNCIGAAHQFISRPWKPPELISIIERSLALDAWLSSDKLRSFVPRLGKLPGLPATYFEVLKRTESPHSSMESIAEVIARDPALTARLLQMVNSPACGLAQKITSPVQAVSMLGMETIKSLVLCLQLFAQSAPVDGASLSLDQLWHHSFSVAKLAAKIALHCVASERMASDAYTAGLLHNIGQIVLATNLSREYAAVVEAARKRKCPLPEVELENLGVTSNQVGAYLLGLWGMPLPLVEAAALFLAPATATSVEFSVLTVVHVANVLAHEENGPVAGLRPPKLDGDYLAALKLPRKTEAWRKLLASNSLVLADLEGPVAEERPLSPEPVLKQVARPVSKLKLAAAVAAIILVVLGLRWDMAFIANKPLSVAAAEAKKSGASAGKTGFDSIKIQGVIRRDGRMIAQINGQDLEVEGRINGVEVLYIDPSCVVLSFKGQSKTFKLK